MTIPLNFDNLLECKYLITKLLKIFNLIKFLQLQVLCCGKSYHALLFSFHPSPVSRFPHFSSFCDISVFTDHFAAYNDTTQSAFVPLHVTDTQRKRLLIENLLWKHFTMR